MKAIVLTREHKAIYPQERARIQKVETCSKADIVLWFFILSFFLNVFFLYWGWVIIFYGYWCWSHRSFDAAVQVIYLQDKFWGHCCLTEWYKFFSPTFQLQLLFSDFGWYLDSIDWKRKKRKRKRKNIQKNKIKNWGQSKLKKKKESYMEDEISLLLLMWYLNEFTNF